MKLCRVAGISLLNNRILNDRKCIESYTCETDARHRYIMEIGKNVFRFVQRSSRKLVVTIKSKVIHKKTVI